MKRIIIMLMILIVLITGCAENPVENDEKSYQEQLENSGYVRITAITKESIWQDQGAWGYVEKEVVDMYLNNELEDYVIRIIHPYEEGRFIAINSDSIVKFKVSNRKDD